MTTPSLPRRLVWLALLTIGCQPAMPYQSGKPAAAPAPAPAASVPIPADPTLGWLDGRPLTMQADTPIVFVHESDGAAWTGLSKYWNLPPTDAEKAAALKDAVQIKVPAGLDKPRDFLPDSNPPTLTKWRLGRQLFYDRTWLGDDESCASCHDPHSGFADTTAGHQGVNTPTLVNCLYNRREFWDGRVESLEEVVQRSLDDEMAPAGKLPFHVWSGVVGRLRENGPFRQRFLNAFGAVPTTDAIGKALATYLRTLLAADSIHDRAVNAQAAAHAPELKAEHYEKALDDAALKALGLAGQTKADAAKRIYRGYRLFHDREERKTGCILCHKGGEFTDGEFHNLGVGFAPFDPGQEPGRFASLPLGCKDRARIGAYKTPTLRGLSRTAPYFHDGSTATLEDAIRLHLDGGRGNDYLDIDMRPREVPEPDFTDLMLFLRALDGGDVDPAVGPPAD